MVNSFNKLEISPDKVNSNHVENKIQSPNPKERTNPIDDSNKIYNILWKELPETDLPCTSQVYVSYTNHALDFVVRLDLILFGKFFQIRYIKSDLFR